MTDALSLPLRAERLVAELPAYCSPAQLGKALGVCGNTIVKMVVNKGYHVLKTASGRRRIPRDVQVRIARELIHRGW